MFLLKTDTNKCNMQQFHNQNDERSKRKFLHWFLKEHSFIWIGTGSDRSQIFWIRKGWIGHHYSSWSCHILPIHQSAMLCQLLYKARLYPILCLTSSMMCCQCQPSPHSRGNCFTTCVARCVQNGFRIDALAVPHVSRRDKEEYLPTLKQVGHMLCTVVAAVAVDSLLLPPL